MSFKSKFIKLGAGFSIFVLLILGVNALVPLSVNIEQLRVEDIKSVEYTYEKKEAGGTVNGALSKEQIIRFEKLIKSFSKETINRAHFSYDRIVVFRVALNSGKSIKIKCRYGVNKYSKEWTDIMINGRRSYISFEIKNFIEKEILSN